MCILQSYSYPRVNINMIPSITYCTQPLRNIEKCYQNTVVCLTFYILTVDIIVKLGTYIFCYQAQVFLVIRHRHFQSSGTDIFRYQTQVFSVIRHTHFQSLGTDIFSHQTQIFSVIRHRYFQSNCLNVYIYKLIHLEMSLFETFYIQALTVTSFHMSLVLYID